MTSTWSPENRLVSYVDGKGDSVSSTYSDDGLRRQRTNNGVTRNLTYDESVLLLETNTSGGLVARYTNFPKMWGGLISQSLNGVSSFFGFDSQTSARILVSFAGLVTDVKSWKAFGEPVQPGSGTETPYGYGAGAAYYSEFPDLFNAWHRWPKPSIGHWRSIDMLGFDGGDWNLYRYVDNNPVLYVDPSGNAGVCCTVRCPLNHIGPDPICYDRNAPLFGRGCAATEGQAIKVANDMADFALLRWNSKRHASCQFKHCRTVMCTPDRGQRGRRQVESEVPEVIRWLSKCSNGMLIAISIIIAAGIVIFVPGIIPAIGRGKERLPAM